MVQLLHICELAGHYPPWKLVKNISISTYNQFVSNYSITWVNISKTILIYANLQYFEYEITHLSEDLKYNICQGCAPSPFIISDLKYMGGRVHVDVSLQTDSTELRVLEDRN